MNWNGNEPREEGEKVWWWCKTNQIGAQVLVNRNPYKAAINHNNHLSFLRVGSDRNGDWFAAINLNWNRIHSRRANIAHNILRQRFNFFISFFTSPLEFLGRFFVDSAVTRPASEPAWVGMAKNGCQSARNCFGNYAMRYYLRINEKISNHSNGIWSAIKCGPRNASIFPIVDSFAVRTERAKGGEVFARLRAANSVHNSNSDVMISHLSIKSELQQQSPRTLMNRYKA